MQTTYFRNIRSQILEEIDAPKRGAWLRVIDPSKDEIQEIATKYNLEADLLADGIDLYEVPRIEHNKDNLYEIVHWLGLDS